MASVVNAPDPDAYEMPKARGALIAARGRIQRGREVFFWGDGRAPGDIAEAVDRNGRPFREFNHSGLLDEARTLSKPFDSWAEAVTSWEGHIEAALGDAVAIEWRVVPEIACEAGKWVIYSRLSWDARKPASAPHEDLSWVFQRTAPPPYLPAAAEEAQAAVRFLRARLQEAEAGNIVAVGLVVVRPGNPLVDVCMLGTAGHRHALVSGTVSLLHELNEAGKVPK